MNELVQLPDCRIFHIERLLPGGVEAKMLEGRVDDPGEVALITREEAPFWQGAAIRGVASLCVDDLVPTVEWGTTDREMIAALGRALKRLGWKSAPTIGPAVYGSAS